MTRKFTLDTGFDTSITLEIDTKIISEDAARRVSECFSDSDEVLNVSLGDHYQAMARQAASLLIKYLLDGYSPFRAVKRFIRSQGLTGGIRIVRYEIPNLSASSLEIVDY